MYAIRSYYAKICMKVALGIFVLLLVGSFLLPSSLAESIDSPLKQSKYVTDVHDVKCRTNFVLIFKVNIWTPACVKPSSVEKLIVRGWASEHDPHHMMMNAEKVFFTLQGDEKIGTLSMLSFDSGPMMTYIDTDKEGTKILATSSGSDSLYVYGVSDT